MWNQDKILAFVSLILSDLSLIFIIADRVHFRTYELKINEHPLEIQSKRIYNFNR